MTTLTMASPARGIPAKLVRWTLVAAMLIGGTLLVVFNEQVRIFEAQVAQLLLPMVTDGNVAVMPDSPVVYFGLGTDSPKGMTISPECTIALLVLPVILLAAAMTVSNRLKLSRLTIGLVVSGLLLFAVNQSRLVLIGWAWSAYGWDGFRWTHTLFGSLVSLVGVALAVGTFLLISMRGSKTKPQPQPRHAN